VLPDKTAELIQKLRGVFDFIVVDMASKLDDLAVALFDVADRIVLVLNPTLPSVKSVRIILDLFGRLEYPEGKAQIVINKVTQELERLKVSIPVAAIEGNLKRKPLGVIPMDERKVLAAINRGVTVIAKDRALPPAKDLVALADALRASVSPEEPERMTPAEEAKSVSRLSRLFGG
jgi:Flp pilus assembly CpaE family ATPase